MDADAQAELVARNAAEPMIEPGPGETKDVCGMSRTGWAVVAADGACTCKPTSVPTLEQQAEANVLAARGSFDAPGFDACVAAELRRLQKLNR